MALAVVVLFSASLMATRCRACQPSRWRLQRRRYLARCRAGGM